MKLFLLLFSAITLAACGDSDDGRIEATGTMEATDVTISAQVSGTLESIRGDEGMSVAEGDTLAVIDQRDLLLQLRQADANLAAAEAQYKLTVIGARREDVTQAEVTYHNANRDLERMRELRATNSIPQKQLEEIKRRRNPQRSAKRSKTAWSLRPSRERSSIDSSSGVNSPPPARHSSAWPIWRSSMS